MGAGVGFGQSGGGGGGGTVTSVNSGVDITVDNTDPANPIINYTGTPAAAITVVANYSALPAVGTVTGEFFWCSAAEGTRWLPGAWGGTYYSAGMYYSNGVTWEFMDVPYQATQAGVDAGVITDQFVTPSTLKNATITIPGLTSGTTTTNANLTGDVTSVGNATTLATVNGNVGSFTNAAITVNAKGLITAASNGTAPVTSVTGTANQIGSTGGATPVISIVSNAILPGAPTIVAPGNSTQNIITTDATQTLSNKTLTAAALGSSTATTQSPLDNSTKVATTAYVDAASALSRFWITVPGTPTRVGNTSFTITDTANANLYDMLFGRTTVLKWTDTGVVKMAMIVSSSYAANAVTITIVGDILASSATMNTFKYATEKARPVFFCQPGTIAVLTNIAGTWQAPCAMKPFSVDGYHDTAGTTNATTYDINKNGTTILTTKLSIASGATSGLGYTVDSGTEIAQGDLITLDNDTVSTIAPITVTVQFFVFPLKYQYLN